MAEGIFPFALLALCLVALQWRRELTRPPQWRPIGCKYWAVLLEGPALSHTSWCMIHKIQRVSSTWIKIFSRSLPTVSWRGRETPPTIFKMAFIAYAGQMPMPHQKIERQRGIFKAEGSLRGVSGWKDLGGSIGSTGLPQMPLHRCQFFDGGLRGVADMDKGVRRWRGCRHGSRKAEQR